jgi:hypothetical protein
MIGFWLVLKITEFFFREKGLGTSVLGKETSFFGGGGEKKLLQRVC